MYRKGLSLLCTPVVCPPPTPDSQDGDRMEEQTDAAAPLQGTFSAEGWHVKGGGGGHRERVPGPSPALCARAALCHSSHHEPVPQTGALSACASCTEPILQQIRALSSTNLLQCLAPLLIHSSRDQRRWRQTRVNFWDHRDTTLGLCLPSQLRSFRKGDRQGPGWPETQLQGPAPPTAAPALGKGLWG